MRELKEVEVEAISGGMKVLLFFWVLAAAL